MVSKNKTINISFRTTPKVKKALKAKMKKMNRSQTNTLEALILEDTS